MISTPDLARRGRAALAALALLALAPPLSGAQAQSGEESPLLQGREALARGDGVAAEIALRRALDAGVPPADIAANLGQAYLIQGDNDAARKWLGPGEFAPRQRRYGFHMLALLEMDDGNLDAARAAFDKALKGNPGTAEIWVDIGRMRYRAGDHHQALAASLQALKLDPKNPRALEFRGQLARDAQGLLSALPWFEKGLKSAPNDLSLMGEYAATLGELGRAKDMLRVTRQMIALDGENPRAFYLQAVLAGRAGNYNLARRLLWRTEDKFDEVPAAMLLEGVLEMRAGNWALAVEALDVLARRQPENERAQLLLGRALLQNGDASELVARYRKVAEQRDASPYMLTLVGRAYEAMGERAQAAPFLDRATQAQARGVIPLPVGDAGELAIFRWGDDPYRGDAAVAKVRKALAAGNTDEAARVVAPLAEHYPGSADVQVLAGDVALARGDAQGALANYRAAAQIRLSFPLMERMVAALRLRGRDAEARALASDYLKQHPQDGEAAEFLGHLAAEAGQWRRARMLFGHAKALRDGGGRDPLLFSTLAETELKLGEAGPALADAEAAHRMQRANPHSALVLARVLRAAGREAEARALEAKAARIRPAG